MDRAGHANRAGVLQVPEPSGRDREPVTRRHDDTCRRPCRPVVGPAGVPVAVAVPHLRVLGAVPVWASGRPSGILWAT